MSLADLGLLPVEMMSERLSNYNLIYCSCTLYSLSHTQYTYVLNLIVIKTISFVMQICGQLDAAHPCGVAKHSVRTG